MTERRALVALSGIWFTTFFIFITLLVYWKFDDRLRGSCSLDVLGPGLWIVSLSILIPLTLIVILNVWILMVAEKHRKRIMAEAATNMSDVNRFFHARFLKHFLLLLQF